MEFFLLSSFIVLVLLAAQTRRIEITLKDILEELLRTRPVLDERPAALAPLADAGRIEDSATSAAANADNQPEAG